jgi:hypothetical protein
VVANALSHCFDLNDKQLTKYCLAKFPLQVPVGFQLCQIPQNVDLWVCSIIALQRSCNPKNSRPPLLSEDEIATDGLSIWSPLELHPIHSSCLSTYVNSEDWQEVTFSPSEREPFLPPSREDNLIDLIHHKYLEGASKKQRATWVMNSSVSIGRAPFTSMAAMTN